MLLYLLSILGLGLRQAPTPSIVVHLDQPVHAVSKNLFGVFFEEINHAGDGGLNAELIRNFNLREPTKAGLVPGWTVQGNGSGDTVETGIGEIDVSRSKAGEDLVGASNGGYWGIPLTKGSRFRYQLTCSSANGTPIELRLVDSKAVVVGRASVTPSPETSMIKGEIACDGDDRAGRLEVGLTQAGAVAINAVSLLPQQSWKGHGLRSDLAEMVDNLKPAFVRFPGGCYVEGGDYLKDRFRWETTLVPAAERHGHLDENWGYWSTDQLGYHEYLQWCEDMGARALFVVNCGFSHRETVPESQLDEYLLNTMDAIEYALGPTTSRLGAIRAARGHPAPFPLAYLEIGNENGLGWPTGGSPSDYAEHYKRFAEAIKAKYPQLTLIADTRRAPGAEMVDDHFYNSPSWFWQNVGLYDHASRTGPKVYVGEYAVTSNCGLGNLRAALGEAAFMTGLERNSDLVKMASYAPLFANVNNRAWNPDAICFNDAHSYGTPSYYVQRMFGANQGDTVLKVDSPTGATVDRPQGGVGLGTWQTQAEFKDLTVSSGGENLYSASLAQPDPDWSPKSGEWSWSDGAYRQMSTESEVRSMVSSPKLQSAENYTLRVKARKLGGDEGFLILFHARDSRHFVWWNIGGWGNHETGVEETNPGGRFEVGSHIPFSVKTGQWYDLRIECAGTQMRLYVDDKLVQSVVLTGVPTLAVSASRVDRSGDVIIKVVNGAETDREIAVNLAGAHDGKYAATTTTLTSSSFADENSLNDPRHVVPAKSQTRFAHTTFKYTFPARSLTILRLHRL